MFRCRLNDSTELRLLEPRHEEELFSLTDSCREHLRKWLPWVDKVEEAADSRAFLQGAVDQFARGQGFQAGIWHEGRLAGVVGYNYLDRANLRTSLGYWLGEEFQGRGLMTMAVGRIVNHSFEELGLHRVEIRCAVENHKSRAIPERLQFSQEGVLRYNEVLYGRRIDHVVYSRVASEGLVDF